MASAGSISVLLQATGATKFSAALDGATQKLKSIGSAGSGSSESMDTFANKLSRLGSVIGGAAITSGFATLAKGAIDLASSFNETTNLIEVGFGNQSAVIESWATSVGDSLGRGSTQMRSFAANTQAMLAPMLGNQQAAMDMSRSVSQLAVDMASFFNATDIEALTALRAGLSGESESLKRFGVVMSDSALNAFALEQGIGKTTSQMSEAEKVSLRFNFIMEKTSLAQGDAERTSAGFANQMKSLRGNIDDLAVKLGSALLPAATSVVSTLSSMADVLSKISPNTATAIAGIGALSVGIVAVTSSVVALKLAWVPIAAAMSASAPIIAAIAAIGVAIASLVGIIATLSLQWDNFKQDMEDKEWLSTVDEQIKKQQDLNREMRSTNQVLERNRDMQNQMNDLVNKLATERVESFAQDYTSLLNPWADIMQKAPTGEAPPSLDPAGQIRRAQEREESMKLQAARVGEVYQSIFEESFRSSAESLADNLKAQASEVGTFYQKMFEAGAVTSQQIEGMKAMESFADAEFADDLRREELLGELKLKNEKKAAEERSKQMEKFSQQISGGLGQLVRGDIAGAIGGIAGGAVGMIAGPATGGVAAAGVGMAMDALKASADIISKVFNAVLSLIGKLASFIPSGKFQSFFQAALESFVSTIGVAIPAMIGLVVALAFVVGFIAMATTPLGPIFVLLGVMVLALMTPFIMLAAAMFTLTAIVFGTIALFAGFLKLATETESFKKFKDVFEISMGKIVTALEPFFDNLMALAGLFDAVIMIVIPLAAAFANNELASKVLFYALKSVAVGLGVFILGVGYFVDSLIQASPPVLRAFSAIVEGLATFADTLKTMAVGMYSVIIAINQMAYSMLLFARDTLGLDVGTAVDDAVNADRRLRDEQTALAATDPAAGLQDLQNSLLDLAAGADGVRPDLDAMKTALADLIGLTYDEADARANNLQLEKEVGETLMNAPSGYKTALSRFNAMDVETGVGRSWSPEDSEDTSGSARILIANMTVQAQNPEEFSDKLSRKAERERFVRTGSTVAQRELSWGRT
jgi:hypothetical protein